MQEDRKKLSSEVTTVSLNLINDYYPGSYKTYSDLQLEQKFKRTALLKKKGLSLCEPDKQMKTI